MTFTHVSAARRLTRRDFLPILSLSKCSKAVPSGKLCLPLEIRTIDTFAPRESRRNQRQYFDCRLESKWRMLQLQSMWRAVVMCRHVHSHFWGHEIGRVSCVQYPRADLPVICYVSLINQLLVINIFLHSGIHKFGNTSDLTFNLRLHHVEFIRQSTK